MMGGGEQSFVDFLSHMPVNWEPIAVIPEKGDIWPRLTERKIEATVIALPALRPWRIIEMILSLRAIVGLCRRRPPSLIYANGSRAAFYAGIVGRLLGCPIVWHCRITDQDPYFDHILSSLSTRIIANSKATAKRFTQRTWGKIKVVYNGVDLDWFRQKGIDNPKPVDSDWKIILMVARASRGKRHDLALSAFEHVAETNPDVHLACVGPKDRLEPGWWRYLQDKTQNSPFSSRIHWIGRAEDIRPWYQAAQVMIFPCEHEGFGRVVVEAMASGVPVVASRSGGVPEIIRDGKDGLLVTPGSSAEISKAIMKLLYNQELRKKITTSAKERANLFSLEAHVYKMARVFEETIRH